MDDHHPTSLPFDLLRPTRQTSPIVVASPHSGRDYAEAFLAAARLDSMSLRRSEDAFVDQLFSSVPGFGIPLLSARFPRAWCDANREPWELDPGMFDAPLPAWVNSHSPRVGAGLGTIARVVANGEPIYRRRLSFKEAEMRVRTCWEPYHAALAALIAETRNQFGTCLLIDCHSMPAHPAQALDPPDFVLGDVHGTACSPRITRAVEAGLQSLHYRVRRNDPYAGGYITRHYGRPREAIHAIQIEISRPLYLDEERLVHGANFAKIQSDLNWMIKNLTALQW